MIVPKNWIGVKVRGGVEPKHVPHLTASSSILVNICLNEIRLPAPISQELKI